MNIKMKDLVPYKHAARCTFAGSDREHVIGIVSLRWMEDGRLSAMLDTHNFIIEHPDTELDYIEEQSVSDHYRREVEAWVLPPRPEPKLTEAQRIEALVRERDEAVRALRLVLRGGVLTNEARHRLLAKYPEGT